MRTRFLFFAPGEAKASCLAPTETSGAPPPPPRRIDAKLSGVQSRCQRAHIARPPGWCCGAFEEGNDDETLGLTDEYTKGQTAALWVARRASYDRRGVIGDGGTFLRA